jgi:hypothetical protein
VRWSDACDHTEIDIKEVEQWYPELVAHGQEERRMKLALSAAPALTKQMRLVSARPCHNVLVS